MLDFRKAKKIILRSKSIVISGHINPDGDSLGSLLSLGLGLKKLGKNVVMISVDRIPKRYHSLPGADLLRKTLDKPADLAITVDCSNKEILGKAFDYLKRSGEILEIDHHEFRRPFGSLSLIDHKAASVGELVYLLLGELKVRIDSSIAQNLMTSIIVETSSFRLPSVRSLTFKICSELIDRGVDFYKLVDKVFWSRSKESEVLTGICLSRCKFLKSGRISWSIIRREDFAKVGGKDEDVDAVADEMRSILGVKIALLFREKDRDTLRVSFRSKEKINVASIAERYLGGGHFDVAGCNIPNNAKSMKEVLKLAEKLI